MTADPLQLADDRLASIDETLRRLDRVAGRGSPARPAGARPAPVPTAGRGFLPSTAPVAVSEPQPAALSVEGVPLADRPPRVLTETWRTLIFRADGLVELSPPRTGPARSDQLRPPVEVRLTDDQLDALFACLWPS